MGRIASTLPALLAISCAGRAATTPASVASAPPAAPACGTQDDLGRALLAAHVYAVQDARRAATSAAPADHDEANVAVLEDRGDLVIRRNPFDLDGAGLRFSPTGPAAYDVRPEALPFASGGTALRVATGGAQAVDLPFAFPFFGASASRVFVNADGNLTLDVADVGPGEQGLGRFLAGPPRIAPFLAALDPDRGGSVTALLTSERAVFAWNGVPGAGQLNRNTFEVAVYPSGAVEMVYGGEMQTREGVVGLSPGATSAFTVADFSMGGGGTGALVERFSETEKADLVSVCHRFLAGHPDVFDQIVVYTTRPLNPQPGTLAFEINTRNDVQGIGLDPTLDESAAWGSAGVLASVVYMDTVDAYLEVDGFEFLGHEVGHRWLARLVFRDAGGRPSNALLGRGLAHWSFFLDSDASVMEGNRIAESGGRFETVDITRGYSALDQYAMGLRGASEVPPFFYVEDPDNFRPNLAFKASSSPQVGVSFSGRSHVVRIEDIVAALGPRIPEAGRAPRLLRQAFVLVADAQAPATDVRRAAAARIRSAFGPFYRDATEGRGTADSTLP